MAGIEYMSNRLIDCLAERHLLSAGKVGLGVGIIGRTQFLSMLVACLNEIGRSVALMDLDHRTSPLG